jgi:hypothetical protein
LINLKTAQTSRNKENSHFKGSGGGGGGGGYINKTFNQTFDANKYMKHGLEDTQRVGTNLERN